MARDYPVGKAQQMVLEKLGEKASGFSDANQIFEDYGITVSSKRQGRSSIPQISLARWTTGQMNIYGEGEGGTKVDLSSFPAEWIAD